MGSIVIQNVALPRVDSWASNSKQSQHAPQQHYHPFPVPKRKPYYTRLILAPSKLKRHAFKGWNFENQQELLLQCIKNKYEWNCFSLFLLSISVSNAGIMRVDLSSHSDSCWSTSICTRPITFYHQNKVWRSVSKANHVLKWFWTWFFFQESRSMVLTILLWRLLNWIMKRGKTQMG